MVIVTSYIYAHVFACTMYMQYIKVGNINPLTHKFQNNKHYCDFTKNA